jgi:hypothetical protein
MRKFSFGMALALAMVGSSSAAWAQTNNTPDTKKTQKAPAAAAAFNPRDLSGIWMDDHARPNKVVERYWIYKFTPDEPPMTAWGQEQFAKVKSGFGEHPFPIKETNDPVYLSCQPAGFPRAIAHPFPFQILQVPGEVLVIFEWDSLRHQIFVDGRKHDEALGPSYMGDSIGHWEGDTLVADTVNFNEKTWLDRMGHPHSDQLHVIERIRRVDKDHLVDDMTIDDPKAYTKPWSAHLTFAVHRKWTLQEQFCEDENTFEGIESNEVKPAK